MKINDYEGKPNIKVTEFIDSAHWIHLMLDVKNFGSLTLVTGSRAFADGIKDLLMFFEVTRFTPDAFNLIEIFVDGFEPDNVIHGYIPVVVF